MIEVYVDNKLLEVDNQDIDLSLTIEIANIEDPESSSSGYSSSIEIPFTPRNCAALDFVEQSFSADQFNNENHTVKIVCDGITIMSGEAFIEKYTYVNGSGSFHMTVMGAAYEWIKNANKPMAELEGGEQVPYLMESVIMNSIERVPTAVKFFPVDRGAFYKESVDGKLVPRKELKLRDYHPFYNVFEALKLILKGYSIKSSLQPLFEKLYCSGTIPDGGDLDVVEEDNDFKCGNILGDTTEDLENRTYIIEDLSKLYPVDVFNNYMSDNEGYFTATKNILRRSVGSDEISFHPTTPLRARFELTMSYTSEVSSNGDFIDTIVFGDPASRFIMHLENSKEAEIAYYTSFPSSVLESQTKFLCYFKVKNIWLFDGKIYKQESSTATPSIIANINVNGQYMYIPITSLSESKDGLRYYLCRADDGSKLFLDEKDNAKLFEFEAVPIIEDKITFNKILTTDPYYAPAINRSKVNTKSIDPEQPFIPAVQYIILGVKFGVSHYSTASDRSIKLELGTCYIVPKFEGGIALGESVKLSTIAGDTSQMDFISAMRQLFNLMFYTNPVSREVIIEPRSSFFDVDSGALNWSSKIDYSQEITIEELGGDIGNSLKLSYSDGNDVVTRYNKRKSTGNIQLGSHTTPLLNKSTTEQMEITNSIFSPFIVRNVNSMGMQMLQNALETEQNLIEEVDMDITPVIGYFNGIAPRNIAVTDFEPILIYPLLCFQSVKNNINLGFEDVTEKDTIVEGLHRFYNMNVHHYNYGRRITLQMNLTPQDVEEIIAPNSYKRDFRSLFVLTIDGELVPCWLETIDGYDPVNGKTAKCSFIIDTTIPVNRTTLISFDGHLVGDEGVVTGCAL